MKPMAGGDASKINKAAESESGNRGMKAPSSRRNSGGVGNETKADMKGAMQGQPSDKNPLKGAMQELHSQHPHKYSDHGPHHSDMSHVRHKPMKLS